MGGGEEAERGKELDEDGSDLVSIMRNLTGEDHLIEGIDVRLEVWRFGGLIIALLGMWRCDRGNLPG